ncbi:34108_t:CDS:2, partial [Gigaspora margarita]
SINILMALNRDLKKNNSLLSEVQQLDLIKNNLLFAKVVRHVVLSKNLIFIAGLVFLVVEGYLQDFKCSNGLFEMINQKYPGSFCSVRDLFDANLHISDKAVKAFYNFIGELNKLVLKTEPIATHLFIKKLADMKKLKRVYTQNIDYLEEKAGLEVWNFENFKHCKPQVVQLHRTLANLQCMLCANVYSFTQEYCDIFTKDKVDCLIIMGTSLKIPGVKRLVKKFAKAVHECKGYVIMVNATNIVTKEWNRVIDYQIVGNCDEWVELIDKELSNIKATKSNNKRQISKKRKRTEIDYHEKKKTEIDHQEKR